MTDAAMRVLWARGYESTSIEDLVAATGLHASSLYAAFGSKRGILQAALDRYEQGMLRTVSPLRDGQDGLDDVIAFLERLGAHVSSPRSQLGCLMVNTMTEVAPHDADVVPRTARYRAALREGIHSGIARAAERGEIDPGSVEHATRLVQAGVFGALVLARAGASEEARGAIDALVHQVQQWRGEPSPPKR